MGQELVAQAFALGGTGHQARNVHELDNRRHHAFRLNDFGQRRQARVGHLDHASVRLDGAEGVVLGGNARLGEGVEESGLAHIGQAHDAAFQAHGVAFW